VSQISARLPDELIAEMDRVADRLQRTRAELIRHVIEYFLDDFEDLHLGLERLQDSSDPILDWVDVRRELLEAETQVVLEDFALARWITDAQEETALSPEAAKEYYNSLDKARSILRTLEPDPEVERLWIEEAERRYQDYLEGREQAIPGEEALRSLRAMLEEVTTTWHPPAS
jgi:predicted DNA-binding protein